MHRLRSRVQTRPWNPETTAMGKIVKCRECGKVYRDLEELEDLRDNDSVCMVCNSTIEVADWDRVLASYEDDDGDIDDEDEDDDWDDDIDDEDDDLLDEEEDDDFADLEDDIDDEDDDEDRLDEVS